MKKPFDFESVTKSALLGIVKWFAWFVLILGLIAAGLILFVKEFDINTEGRDVALFSVVTSVFSIAIYFSFLGEGQLKGKDDADYVTNLESYLAAIAGRRRDEIAAWIAYYRKVEQREFVKSVADALGLTEGQIMMIPHVWFNRHFTFMQKIKIQRVKKKKFPNSAPKNAAAVLNILAANTRGSHGVDVKAKRRFLFGRGLTKIIFTAVAMGVTGMLMVVMGIDNWFDAVIKAVFVVFSFAFSLFGGFSNGLKATTIEKDILANILRFLSDMDIWLEAGKPSEPTDKGQGN